MTTERLVAAHWRGMIFEKCPVYLVSRSCFRQKPPPSRSESTGGWNPNTSEGGRRVSGEHGLGLLPCREGVLCGATPVQLALLSLIV